MTSEVLNESQDEGSPKESSSAQAFDLLRRDRLEHYEQIARTLVIGIAVAYAVGLVVVNAYLAQYGIAEWGLLRSRFVLTGILAVVPIVVAFSLVRAASQVVIRWMPLQQDANWGEFLGRSIVVLAIVVLVPGVLYVTLLGNMGVTTSLIQTAFWMALAPGVLAWSMYLGRSIHISEPPTHSSTTSSVGTHPKYSKSSKIVMMIGEAFTNTTILSLFAVIWCLGYANVFVNRSYANIPEQFGGGKPRPIEMLFDTSHRQKFAHLELPVQFGTSLTETVELIWQGDQGYLIRYEVEGELKVVLIDRDLVDAIILSRTAD